MTALSPNSITPNRTHQWVLTFNPNSKVEYEIPSYVVADVALPTWRFDSAGDLRYSEMGVNLLSVQEINVEKQVLELMKTLKTDEMELVLKMLNSSAEVVSEWAFKARISQVTFSHLDYNSNEPVMISMTFVIDTLTIK